MARIESVEVLGDPGLNSATGVTDDGSTASVASALMERSGPRLVLFRVTVVGVAPGTAELELSVSSIGDVDGDPIDYRITTGSSTVTVVDDGGGSTDATDGGSDGKSSRAKTNTTSEDGTTSSTTEAIDRTTTETTAAAPDRTTATATTEGGAAEDPGGGARQQTDTPTVASGTERPPVSLLGLDRVTIALVALLADAVLIAGAYVLYRRTGGGE